VSLASFSPEVLDLALAYQTREQDPIAQQPELRTPPPHAQRQPSFAAVCRLQVHWPVLQIVVKLVEGAESASEKSTLLENRVLQVRKSRNLEILKS